jgi:hypothetical protein
MRDDIRYVVLENDDGLIVVGQHPNQSLEDAAVKHGGRIVDDLTYRSYDDAYDALLIIQREADLIDQD